MAMPTSGVTAGAYSFARMPFWIVLKLVPAPWARATGSGSKKQPIGLVVKSVEVRLNSLDFAQSPKLALCNSTK